MSEISGEVNLLHSEDIEIQVELKETPKVVGVVNYPRNGDSAYQTALDNGFQGTEEDWITSLRGERGGIFVPSIDENNVLSWENDAGLENPEPVQLNKPATAITINRWEEN